MACTVLNGCNTVKKNYIKLKTLMIYLYNVDNNERDSLKAAVAAYSSFL